MYISWQHTDRRTDRQLHTVGDLVTATATSTTNGRYISHASHSTRTIAPTAVLSPDKHMASPAKAAKATPFLYRSHHIQRQGLTGLREPRSNQLGEEVSSDCRLEKMAQRHPSSPPPSRLERHYSERTTSHISLSQTLQIFHHTPINR